MSSVPRVCVSISDSGASRQLPVIRYLSGDCSPAEAEAFERWVAADPARQQELDALRHLWEASAEIPSADRVNEMWSDVARQMDGAAEPALRLPPGTAPRSPGRRFRPAWWGIGVATAATLALVFAQGLQKSREAVSLPRAVGAGPRPEGLVKEYRTLPGQRSTIQLIDGTRIELGVASVLRVHPFTGPRRLVELDGEAVFDVVHNAARPFTVRTYDAAIDDLGTKFAVHAYRNDQRLRVAVLEGTVAVRPTIAPSAEETVLQAGDVAVLDRRHRLRAEVQRGVTPEIYVGWTTGRFLFENATLAEVAAELERWYDVRVAIATPALAERRVTATIPIRSLTDVLDLVAAPLGIEYRYADGVVRLDGQR